MKYKIDYLTDIVGNTYIGVKIYKDNINSYLNQLKTLLGKDYDIYVNNQQKRDMSNGRTCSHHITVVNAFELKKLMSSPDAHKYVEYINSIIENVDIDDLTFKGIGRSTKEDNTAYYIVVESDMLNEFINKLSLQPKDLHITLGFNKQDVHGVRKNTVLSMRSLLKMKIEYYKNKYNGLSFIFDVVNNLDDNLITDVSDIKVLELNDTVYKISIKNTILGISIINDELRVVYQYNN